MIKGYSMQQTLYPFSAVVGQERVKKALILCTLDPKLGGILVSGPKGSGKSTLIRALEDILPSKEYVKGCSYTCDPLSPESLCLWCREELSEKGILIVGKRRLKIVELPLGATEDGLIGTINAEEAIIRGIKVLEPGLLGKANQNILYIDEINLLPDYLIDSILDPAASGWNTVQREGLNLVHPADFTLIASMNPEEGDLRPQILDRFALKVEMEKLKEPKQREEVVRRNISYEENPEAFLKEYEEEQKQLREKIDSGRHHIQEIEIPDNIMKGIAEVCSELRIEGLRSDIAILKAARANAALEGRKRVQADDAKQVLDLAVVHRIKDEKFTRDRVERFFVDEIPSELVEVSKLEEGMVKTDSKLGDLKPLGDYEGFVKRRMMRKPLNRFLFVLVIFAMLIFLTFTTMITTSFLQVMFFGRSLESLITSLTPRSFFFNFLLLSALFGIVVFFSPRTRPIRYLYTFLGQESDRRIVRQLSQHTVENEKEKEIKETTKTLNIPIYASIRSLFDKIAETGAKIFKGWRKEEGKRYRFMLHGRKDRRIRSVVGKKSKTKSKSKRGRYVSYEFPKSRPWDIAMTPTLRAAAPYQRSREWSKLALKIMPEDVRVKVRETKSPLSVILLLDMSESMVASLVNVRNAVMSMREIAFRRKDRIGLVVFKGQEATTIQNPTSNIELILKKLMNLGASNLTPLASGLYEASRVIRNETRRNMDAQPVLVVISDGITNIPLKSPLNLQTRATFRNSAQADVVDALYLLKKMNVTALAINPSHQPVGSLTQLSMKTAAMAGKKWLEPTELMMEIPRITGGYYYGIGKGGSLEEVVLTEAFSILGNRI
jgi:Mg-chelatase subunit ChlI/Mg-chelatase subunit ChlD